MAHLKTLGIARNEAAVTIFVHVGIEGHSTQRLGQAGDLEADLIALMRAAAPDADDAVDQSHYLAEHCQALRDRGHAAELLLGHLTGKVSRGTRGKDIEVETTLGDLLALLTSAALSVSTDTHT